MLCIVKVKIWMKWMNDLNVIMEGDTGSDGGCERSYAAMQNWILHNIMCIAIGNQAFKE